MYLIDTDIIVFALRGDQRVRDRLATDVTEPRVLSVITYGELLLGAMRSTRSAENVASVRQIAKLYPVIEVSRPIVEAFASLKTHLARQGQLLEDFDLLIAATALSLGCTLVTGNVRHFERVPDLTIENWVV